MPEDRIDRFTETWSKAYPDLDTWPLRILGRATRLASIVEQQGQILRENFGVHMGEIQVLTALRRSLPDFTLSPKDITEHTLVTSAAVTLRLNSLEEKGLVARRIDERSRRRILVTLTPAGVELIESYIRILISNQTEITDGMTEAERLDTEGSLRRLLLLAGDSVSEDDASPGFPM